MCIHTKFCKFIPAVTLYNTRQLSRCYINMVNNRSMWGKSRNRVYYLELLCKALNLLIADFLDFPHSFTIIFAPPSTCIWMANAFSQSFDWAHRTEVHLSSSHSRSVNIFVLTAAFKLPLNFYFCMPIKILYLFKN